MEVVCPNYYDSNLSLYNFCQKTIQLLPRGWIVHNSSTMVHIWLCQTWIINNNNYNDTLRVCLFGGEIMWMENFEEKMGWRENGKENVF